MTPEQWERVARLYEAASVLPSEERVAFLREACDGNEALREEVQSLLASEGTAGDFLNAGALHDAADLLVQDNLLSLVGERLDSYEVLSLIGTGGMGEVYRAHDSRLGRDVAIKVLPALVTESADARSRFEREARAVAALSHSNIRSLYDVGKSRGRMYAVMELLEGETLRARLLGGPLPIRKAVEIGAAIADGLAAAHTKGIVHRDLKPENVFITTDGVVKVLDFGLAKTLEPIAPQAVDRQAGDDDPGGTYGYMSPEQASGGKVDARSDLFSFGCVLYEMIIGRRSFERHTAPQLTAAIVNEEPPDLETVRADVRRIIAHCLEKEPQERFQSAQDLAFHLRSLNLSEARGRQPAQTQDRRRAGFVVGVIATATLALAVWLLMSSDPVSLVQSHLTPPPNVTVNFDLGLAISPDGRSLAYVARSSDDPTEGLWVQPLDGGPARPLPGTDGARYPFWSPDSRSVAFFAENSLMRTEASGGTPRRLCGPVNVNQGAWGPGDVIVFGGFGSGLRGVSAAGGDPFPVTELDSTRGEEGHAAPVFLRDGRRLLFYTIANSEPSVRGIYVTMLGSKRSELVSAISGSPGRTRTLAIAGAHLVFMQEGRLMAAPFDDARPRLKAEATPLADRVGVFSLSATGILVYAQRLVTDLAWLDRSGRPVEGPRIRGDFSVPALSHDGRRVAVMSYGESDTADVWIYDVGTGIGFALTNHPGIDGFPLWSPDDEWVYFHSDRTGRYELYRKRATGVGTEESVLGWDSAPWATSWSRDGALILSDSRPESEDLWQLTPGRNAVALVKTPFREWAVQVSPDGQWIAYNSNETGQAEVFVRAFPPSGTATRVSNNGGIGPKWRGDSKELFFIDASRRMMAVEVPLQRNLDRREPRPLFELPMMRRRFAPRVIDFDVASDGQRFLLVRIPPDTGRRPLTLLQNWTAGLKR
jgi:eukaryotic-like serine/threonine-protein kinase